MCYVSTAMQEIAEDRPLTEQEHALVRWMLEHGRPDAVAYLEQLSRARVVARCPCGCASVDFSIGGQRPPTVGGMDILSDWQWHASEGQFCGAFVFARHDQLAGLEIWSIDGQSSASVLPQTSELEPFGTGPHT